MIDTRTDESSKEMVSKKLYEHLGHVVRHLKHELEMERSFSEAREQTLETLIETLTRMAQFYADESKWLRIGNDWVFDWPLEDPPWEIAKNIIIFGK